MKSKERDRLIDKLVYENGCVDEVDLLKKLEFETSAVNGICQGCGETCYTEPDAMDGLCQDCDEHAVISIYCLLEMI